MTTDRGGHLEQMILLYIILALTIIVLVVLYRWPTASSHGGASLDLPPQVCPMLGEAARHVCGDAPAVWRLDCEPQ